MVSFFLGSVIPIICSTEVNSVGIKVLLRQNVCDAPKGAATRMEAQGNGK